ncbi:MAG: hypothetical protein JWM73_2828 [Solirubrobacterales bacterium]|nr:hypothetical protein [Solirubrobacterales bacterium]
MAIVAVADLYGLAGRRAELEALLAAEEREAAAQPGCVRYSFGHAVTEPDRFVLIAEWSGQAAIDAHYRSARFAAFQAALGGLLARPSSMTQYAVGAITHPIATGPMDPRDAD